MKIKQLTKLTEIFNVDVRRVARQKFRKDLNSFSVKVCQLENGGYKVWVRRRFGSSDIVLRLRLRMPRKMETNNEN